MPITIPSIGLGCVSLKPENSDIVDYALAKGITLFDTADCYENGASEIALGQKLKNVNRESLTICSKVGVQFTPEGVKLCGKREYILNGCEASLKRLQTSYIDIYYLHRVDPNVEFEISIHALAELLRAKKIRAVGLSEVTEQQIRRANKICPISVVQIEYSPWSREDEKNGVIDTCRELKIRVVAYSPIGRGFFTALEPEYFKNLPASDFRYCLPRFQGENLEDNLKIRVRIQEIAAFKGCPVAQLVLAWELEKNMIVIPSTVSKEHFDENLGGINVKLTPGEINAMNNILNQEHFLGARYPDPKISAIYPEHVPSISSKWNKKNVLVGISFLATVGGLFAYNKMRTSGPTNGVSAPAMTM